MSIRLTHPKTTCRCNILNTAANNAPTTSKRSNAAHQPSDSSEYLLFSSPQRIETSCFHCVNGMLDHACTKQSQHTACEQTNLEARGIGFEATAQVRVVTEDGSAR